MLLLLLLPLLPLLPLLLLPPPPLLLLLLLLLPLERQREAGRERVGRAADGARGGRVRAGGRLRAKRGAQKCNYSGLYENNNDEDVVG